MKKYLIMMFTPCALYAMHNPPSTSTTQESHHISNIKRSTRLPRPLSPQARSRPTISPRDYERYVTDKGDFELDVVMNSILS